MLGCCYCHSIVVTKAIQRTVFDSLSILFFSAVMEMIKEELKECKAWRMVLQEFCCQFLQPLPPGRHSMASEEIFRFSL